MIKIAKIQIVLRGIIGAQMSVFLTIAIAVRKILNIVQGHILVLMKQKDVVQKNKFGARQVEAAYPMVKNVVKVMS
jgi:hypothetical protein